MAEQSETAAHDPTPTRGTDASAAAVDARPADPSGVATTVAFECAPDVPVAGDPVLFEAEVPTCGPDAEYEWAFGDGATATGETASNVYDAGGEHAVTLTVTDDDGVTRTAERRVTVYREVSVAVGEADDGLLPVTVGGLGALDPADAVAVESLRAGAPTALAAGAGAAPVRSDATDDDLRIWIPAERAGLRDVSPVRIAGHTTGGVPIAGTAVRR